MTLSRLIRCKLQPRKAGIEAVSGDQLVVRTFGDDAPALHHHDPVGLFHRRQTVRNHEGCAVLGQGRDGLLHGPLAFGVQR